MSLSICVYVYILICLIYIIIPVFVFFIFCWSPKELPEFCANLNIIPIIIPCLLCIYWLIMLVNIPVIKDTIYDFLCLVLFYSFFFLNLLRTLENVRLLESLWQWMILYLSRLGRYELCWISDSLGWILASLAVTWWYLFLSYDNLVLFQIVKPRPMQTASIPGMLGMFQIVCSSIY